MEFRKIQGDFSKWFKLNTKHDSCVDNFDMMSLYLIN